MQHQIQTSGFHPSHSAAGMLGLGDQISHVLHVARALAASGRQVDISGLEREVGRLCAQTLDLEPEQGRALRPMLAGLLAELDILSGTLDRQRERMPRG